MDKQAAGGGQSTSKSTCEVPARTLTVLFGDRSASSMSKWRPAWTLTPEMIHFRTKSVTLSMLIDLLTSTMSCRSTQVKIASTDLWPQEMFTFSEMLALVESESSFGAYVCHRRPGGYRATSDLVRVCMYVCMCVTLVTMRGWEGLSRCRLVGSCVLPGEDFFT